MEEKILIGFLIKQIHIAFETRCHKNLQRYNLTPSQMDVLLYLKRHEEDKLTQRDLETGLTLKNPTVTGLLNRLEEKGFITREQNLNDKRSKFIKMTERCLFIYTRIRCPSAKWYFRGRTRTVI